MRVLALIFFLLAPMWLTAAEETNYFCVVCGKGPLTGQVWLSKWGAICDDCYKLDRRCSLCGLPIRDSDDYAKTGDGRFICRFDKPRVILDAATAREVFANVRTELIGLFGARFLLNNPEVTVNLFDVDYWSENGHNDGMHKFGFSNTRKTGTNEFTHEVVLLSGRFATEIAATAAHEYTHLWLNENQPTEHVLTHDEVEGICELVAYKLVESRGDIQQEKEILANPYSHGEITNLVSIEKQSGMNFILDWVINGTGSRLDPEQNFTFTPPLTPIIHWRAIAKTPPPIPKTLKLGGLILGLYPQALISGVSFSAGDIKIVKLKDSSVQVHCLKISDTNVVLEADGYPGSFTLKVGEEKTGL
jgi:hypothetical protein